MKKAIRILIVDDQRLFAGSLKVVLEEYGNGELEIVGIAHDGDEAVKLADSSRPDVVLMDVRMPNMDGVEATRIIHQENPGIKIMMLTTFDDDAYVNQALSGGAVGYILKNIEPEELITSIKAVFNGTYLVSSAVGYKLFSTPNLPGALEGSDAMNGNPDDIAEVNFLLVNFPSLRRREAAVLHLMLQGYDNNQIANQLFIAEQTVRNYASVIYTKLGVASRLHVIQLIKGMLSLK